MGITVRHDVDPAITGTAAILAGQGEYKRWLMEQQQKMAMQRAQLDAQRQSQILSLKSQRESQEADRQARYDQTQMGYQREDMEYERRRQDGLADLDSKRAYDAKMLQDERSYAEKQADAKLLRDNAGWDAVKPIDMNPAQLPGWADKALGIVEMPFDPSGSVSQEAIWRNDPLDPRLHSNPQGGTQIWNRPDNPDDLDLTAYDRRRVDQINNQISQIRDAKDVMPGAKAKALMGLNDDLQKILSQARPKQPMYQDDEPRRVDGGRIFNGKFIADKPAPEPKPAFSERDIYRAAEDIMQNGPKNDDGNPTMPFESALAEARKRIGAMQPPAKISTPADVAKLPSGAVFIDPITGRKMRKR